jgi:hypothetical protein
LAILTLVGCYTGNRFGPVTETASHFTIVKTPDYGHQSICRGADPLQGSVEKIAIFEVLR